MGTDFFFHGLGNVVICFLLFSNLNQILFFHCILHLRAEESQRQTNKRGRDEYASHTYTPFPQALSRVFTLLLPKQKRGELKIQTPHRTSADAGTASPPSIEQKQLQ